MWLLQSYMWAGGDPSALAMQMLPHAIGGSTNRRLWTGFDPVESMISEVIYATIWYPSS